RHDLLLALRSTGKRSWRSGYKVEFRLRCTVLNTLSWVQALSASLRWSADLQPDARVLCACNSRRPRAAGPPPDGALQRHDVFMVSTLVSLSFSRASSTMRARTGLVRRPLSNWEQAPRGAWNTVGLCLPGCRGGAR